MEVSYDKYSLIIDGKRVFIKSGAFHYFRTPGEEMARDRFMKMKAGGYNTVDIYFNWNYHSPRQGEYDFSGIKDVRKVLKAAQDVGIAYAHRHIFLDNQNDKAYILGQLAKVEKLAHKNGYAIAIGHPKTQTYAALKEWLPTVDKKGIKIIPLSKAIEILNPSVK